MNEIVQFNAGELKEFSGVGDFFRVLSATDTLTVWFYNRGKEISFADSINIGYWEEFKNGLVFDKVAIQSTNAQTIQFATRLSSRVGYEKPPVGNVAITNTGGAFTQAAAANVTTASTALLAASTARRYLLIQNKDAAVDVYVTFDGLAATVAKGVKIPAGGSYELQGYVPTGAVNAITAAGSNANLITLEG